MRRPGHSSSAAGTARRLHRGFSPTVAGILAVAFVALIGYAAFHKRLPFVHGYRLHAIVASANQLRAGSPVRVAGVQVGKVTAIAAGPGATSDITMEIGDIGRPIHRDATLRIRPRLFLEGSFYVQVDPGSPSGAELSDGDTIPLPQTSIPVQFNQVLTALDRPTRTSLKDIIDRLNGALGQGGVDALKRADLQLAPALRDVASVAQATRGSEPHDLSQTIGATSRVTAALAGQDRALADLVTGLNRTSATLASRDASLSAGVRQLDAVLAAAPPTLEAIDNNLAPLERFATTVQPGLRELPRTLRAANPVLAQLRAITRPGVPRRQLLGALRGLLTDFPLITQRLSNLLPSVTPVTECVRTRILPVLYSKLDDGTLSTGRPVWQDFVHATVGLSSVSQSFDGNGPWLRYLAGFGDQTVPLGGPGVGQLIGRSGGPILGARPIWLGPGNNPPLRPDQSCLSQAPPDLGARGSITTAATSRRAAGTLGLARRRAVVPVVGALLTAVVALQGRLR